MGLAPFPEDEHVIALEKETKNIMASGSSGDTVYRKLTMKNWIKNAVTYADNVRSTDG